MKASALLFSLLVILSGPAPGARPATKTGEKEKKIDVNNPIRKISSMMEKAGELLDKLNTGKLTQEEQKKILKELDRLIEMAQSSSSSSSQKPQKKDKQEDPQNRQQPQNTGAAGSSPMGQERDAFRAVRSRLGTGAPDVRQMWGKLPDAPRGEILQLLSEKLPLKYRQLLYWYSKALSEKK